MFFRLSIMEQFLYGININIKYSMFTDHSFNEHTYYCILVDMLSKCPACNSFKVLIQQLYILVLTHSRLDLRGYSSWHCGNLQSWPWHELGLTMRLLRTQVVDTVTYEQSITTIAHVTTIVYVLHNKDEWMKMNLLGYTYKIYNSGFFYNIEMIKQSNTGDPLDTPGGLYRGQPSMI